MKAGIRFRPINPEDKPFLAALYASTREEELAPVDWSDAEKATFLASQFEAQHTFYMENFQSADFLLILLEEAPIGRLYIDRRQDEIRLIDIALVPQERRKGIGSSLLEDILAEASAAEKPVRIHVERFNPALRLYERLGFEKIEDKGVYYLLEKRSGEQPEARPDSSRTGKEGLK